jgi:hypothetical protein
VDELDEDARVGAGPGVDGLLLVADGEDVTVIAPDLADDLVLERIEILELVHEHIVPARAHAVHDVRVGEQLGSPDDERVEVDGAALLEKSLVAVEGIGVVPVHEGLSPEAMGAEAREERAVPLRGVAESAQDGPLIALVGDAESGLEPDARSELAQ